MKIDIQIDRLVLEGVKAGASERARIRASVETELARLIGEQGLNGGALSGGAIPSVPAPPFRYGGDSPQGMGRKIAQSVYASLGKQK